MAGVFMNRMKGHFANEMAVATPNGKLLSGSPKEGLAKWRGLPEKDRRTLEDLGPYDPSKDPSPPPGGLVLKVYARGLERDDTGQHRIYRHPKAHLSQEAGRDHLWMTREEWKSLLPKDPRAAKAGDVVEVPGPLVDRLCRRYLIDLVRVGGEGGPRARKDVVSQDLKLVVEANESGGDQLRLRLEGAAAYLTRGRENGVADAVPRVDGFRIRGVVEFDKARGAVTRFDAVARCDTGHYDEIGKKLLPLGVAFELSPAETPADRVRPHSLYDKYFD